MVVAGGSISGLLAAREISKKGFSVAVFEEDSEIGLPEKCDGLVSLRGVSDLRVPLSSRVLQNSIRRAVLYSPRGVGFEVDARRQNVIVLSRRAFDKFVGEQAQELGADVRTAQRVQQIDLKDDEVVFDGKFGRVNAHLAIDARGYSSLVVARRKGAIQGGKYVVRGSWFDKQTVEIYFDNNLTPGFFRWVIPINEELAKVGAAGEEINPFKLLDKFVEEKRGRVVSKIAGPIVTSGPREKFVIGRQLIIGEAAGQTKPTTGGGIYSGGMGGLLAGKAIADSLASGKLSSLQAYESSWRRLFGGEFRSALIVRKMLARLDNKRLEMIFRAALDSGVSEKISNEGDFDFHISSILRLLGLRKVARLLGSLALPM